MKIGIDVDDTIVETIWNFVEFCNGKGFDVGEKNLGSYYLIDALGLDKKELRKLYDAFNDEGFFNSTKLFEFVKEGIYELEKKNDLFIITSRPQRVSEQTKVFLDNSFGKDFFKEIIHSHHEQKKSKGDLAEELNLDFMIEDSAEHALDCVEKGIKVFLLDKPWNQNVEHKNIFRVKDWKELMKKFKEIEND